MTDSLFHEIYGTYFTVVRNILSQQQPLTTKALADIIRTQGFGESSLQLLPSLQNQRLPWYLLMEKELGLWAPITQNPPPLNQTLLERRWLKTLLRDPRLLFFLTRDEIEVLEQQFHDVLPLFDLATLTYYDQFKLTDSLVEQELQQTHFKLLVKAISTQQSVKIDYQRHPKAANKTACFIPFKLEYSPKNNLFRLRAWRLLRTSRFEVTLNLDRILAIQLVETTRDYQELPITSRRRQAKMTCLLIDERQALKRSMLHFADYHKTTQRLSETRYELTIHYDTNDETELLIRLLSFGPFLKVISPTDFVDKIKERIDAQAKLMADFKEKPRPGHQS